MLREPREHPVGKTDELEVLVGPIPALIVLTGPYAGQVYYLSSPNTSIGRASDNDLQLDDPEVAPRQAAIRLSDGQALLYDLLSPGGVQVNGSPIPLRHRLSHGDEIVIGRTRLRYIDPRQQG